MPLVEQGSYARIWMTRPDQAARVSVSRAPTPSVNVTRSTIRGNWFALETAPRLCGGLDELEDRQLRRILREIALGADGSASDGGEDAFDRIAGAEVDRPVPRR